MLMTLKIAISLILTSNTNLNITHNKRLYHIYGIAFFCIDKNKTQLLYGHPWHPDAEHAEQGESESPCRNLRIMRNTTYNNANSKIHATTVSCQILCIID